MQFIQLPKQFPEFLVAEFANPAFASGDGHICKVALVLNHLVDTFLEGVLGDEAVDENVLMLPDAVGTVGGLRLDGRIPPEVVVDDMAGGSEVETSACGLQREEEDAVCAGIVLETLHHLLTLLNVAASVQEERTLAQSLFNHLREHVAHLAELSEDEHFLTTLNDTLQEREQHFRLA